MPRDLIIKDSSIWRDAYSFSRVNAVDTQVRMGIVRTADFNDDLGDTVYVVEVQDRGDKLFVPCRQMRRFGGVFNYEDYILQSYSADEAQDAVGAFDTKAGDTVLIAYINGRAREGIILGGITHLARKSDLQASDGPQYKSAFNGVFTEINKDGEISVTFKGVPTNADVLKNKPNGSAIPEPIFDEAVGGSFWKFDATGGWTVSDGAQELTQSIKIDKASGTTVITSGNITLTLIKESEAVSLQAKTLTINSADAVSTLTKEWSTEASTSAKLKAPKVAIGTDGTELLDQIVKLIDEIGKVKIITPVGPAAPVMAAPEWAQVEQIKSKINGIKGSL